MPVKEPLLLLVEQGRIARQTVSGLYSEGLQATVNAVAFRVRGDHRRQRKDGFSGYDEYLVVTGQNAHIENGLRLWRRRGKAWLNSGDVNEHTSYALCGLPAYTRDRANSSTGTPFSECCFGEQRIGP